MFRGFMERGLSKLKDNFLIVNYQLLIVNVGGVRGTWLWLTLCHSEYNEESVKLL